MENKKQYINKLYKIMILIMFAYNSNCNTCSQCIDVIKNSCQQCSSYCPSQYTQIFQYCTSNECPSNLKSQCAGWLGFPKNVTQSYCISTCCTDINDNHIKSIQNCMNKNNKDFRAGMIILGTLCGTFFIVFIIGCLVAKLTKLKNMRETTTQQISTVQLYKNINRHMNKNTYQWQQQQKQNNLYQPSSICSICIEDQPNLIIQCGHWFHLHCIRGWYERTPNCPVCKHTIVEAAKFYCIFCKNKYIVVDFARIGSMQILTQKVKGSICNSCKIIHQPNQ